MIQSAKRYTGLLLALLTITPAAAQDYDQACNANGYIVTANAGVFKEAPIYLGKSCDAFQNDHGEGTWCWLNSGINVKLSTGNWLLSRVEITCEHPSLNPMACSCIDFSSGGN